LKTVLIVNDKLTVDLATLSFRFRWPDIQVIKTAWGKGAALLVEKESPDFVILVFDIPDIDGMIVLEEIRQFSDVPIVILSDRTESTDVIKALEAGADDYLTKPYDPGILLARVSSILRRNKMFNNKRDARLIFGDLIVDNDLHKIFNKGKLVNLTSTEWRLLRCLIRNAGRVVSFKELWEKTWSSEFYGNTTTIRTFICRLRKKLGDNLVSSRLIASEQGIGYRFVKPQ
jgi:DNA-binding response OmpR family regulator